MNVTFELVFDLRGVMKKSQFICRIYPDANLEGGPACHVICLSCYFYCDFNFGPGPYSLDGNVILQNLHAIMSSYRISGLGLYIRLF